MDGMSIPTTQVSMADGTTKMVKDIELGDMVLAMNHETGNIEPTPIIIVIMILLAYIMF